ncbi:MAG: DUF5703 domain-containing protein, partial [Bacteroidales bacterium]|nr:DUF5703 domain-containing protein [Bacteroidales bacterium]
MKQTIRFYPVLLLFAALAGCEKKGDSISQYNTVWDTPSEDSFGSMPLGNGDIGLNVWFEKTGDLL